MGNFHKRSIVGVTNMAEVISGVKSQNQRTSEDYVGSMSQPQQKGKEMSDNETSRTRTVLSVKIDYQLSQWLHGRTFVSSDSFESLARLAATDLNAPQINGAHVRYRMNEFGMSIPGANDAMDVAARLVALEAHVKSLAQVIDEQKRVIAQAHDRAEQHYRTINELFDDNVRFEQLINRLENRKADRGIVYGNSGAGVDSFVAAVGYGGSGHTQD